MSEVIRTFEGYYLIPFDRFNIFSVGETIILNSQKHRKCTKCQEYYTIKEFCDNTFDIVKLKDNIVPFNTGVITFCSKCKSVMYYVINHKPISLEDIDNFGQTYILCKFKLRYEKLMEIFGD